MQYSGRLVRRLVYHRVEESWYQELTDSSHWFIGVFIFRGLTKVPACVLKVFVFTRVFTRSRLFIDGFYFRGSTEGPACLL